MTGRSSAHVLICILLCLIGGSLAHGADKPVMRGRNILRDQDFFDLNFTHKAIQALRKVLDQPGSVRPVRLTGFKTHPNMTDLIRVHGPADHTYRHQGKIIACYNYVGLVTDEKAGTNEIEAVVILGRDYAKRLAALQGALFRDMKGADGQTLRLFYVNGAEVARWTQLAPGRWSWGQAALRDGVYLRHWDETASPDVIFVREGVVERRLYYRNGFLYQRLPFVDGVWQGTSSCYYPSGKLEKELPLVNGILEGDVLQFYPSGTLSARLPHRAGKKHGVCRSYNPDGSLRWEATFEYGLLHGLMKQYDTRGKLSRQTPFVRGKQNGVEKSYAPDGYLYSTQIYRNGKPEGPETIYDAQGNIRPRVTARDIGGIDDEVVSSLAEARAKNRLSEIENAEEELEQAAESGEQRPVSEASDSDDKSGGKGLLRRLKFW